MHILSYFCFIFLSVTCKLFRSTIRDEVRKAVKAAIRPYKVPSKPACLPFKSAVDLKEFDRVSTEDYDEVVSYIYICINILSSIKKLSSRYEILNFKEIDAFFMYLIHNAVSRVATIYIYYFYTYTSLHFYVSALPYGSHTVEIRFTIYLDRASTVIYGVGARST